MVHAKKATLVLECRVCCWHFAHIQAPTPRTHASLKLERMASLARLRLDVGVKFVRLLGQNRLPRCRGITVDTAQHLVVVVPVTLVECHGCDISVNQGALLV